MTDKKRDASGTAHSVSSLQKLGELLHQRRSELKLSLKEAENATSIRMNYLQALEQGEVERLISPVYAQGFFKQYANFLGLDGDTLVREHISLFHRPEMQEFSYGIGTLEGRGQLGSGVAWFPNFLWIVLLFLMVALAWYLSKFFELL